MLIRAKEEEKMLICETLVGLGWGGLDWTGLGWGDYGRGIAVTAVLNGGSSSGGGAS